MKNENRKEKVIEDEKKKGKTEANREKKKEATPTEDKDPGKIKNVIWPDFLISLRNLKLLCLLEKHFSKCPSMLNF